MIIRYIKFKVASFWFQRLYQQIIKEGVPQTEEFRMKWNHLQGQILTGGRIKWEWKKILNSKN